MIIKYQHKITKSIKYINPRMHNSKKKIEIK